ncbi:MAG: hypothetical protein KBF99_10725 [Leptospiraceae bacterium]|nr:hypothetical protein [Leptospiraceae bacterium]MBK9503721.1 hypothetical protein [Leptospiraceae bacterium]MBP9163646.1 hypothetical protein [Leptospiraceae bacterium]
MSIFKKIPNPFGKKGGEAHQEKVEEVADEVETRDLKVVKEKNIDLSTGKRRYIDVAGIDLDDNIVELHQVGKQTKKGLPVKRERVVIEVVQSVKKQVLKLNFIPTMI